MDATDALGEGLAVLLPTDGVYGLCCALDEDAARRLYDLKGREHDQPTALIASNVDLLFTLLPELREESAAIARTLLPGPYTLVFPNPERRYTYLTGSRPETIGVRVADLPAPAQQVLDVVGAVAATSANDPGDPPAASLEEVPARIRARCGAEIDAGRLPGVPSTVIDFTGPEPVVLRQGAGKYPPSRMTHST
jgi:L-threonylcarbamoyladenylate synthase